MTRAAGWPRGWSVCAALRSDDPDQVEPVLEALSTWMPASHLRGLQAALAAYDFRGAEGLVDELAQGLNIAKELEP